MSPAPAPDPRPSPHLRRAILARRVRIVLAIAAAAFVIYRLVETFSHPGPPR